MLFETWHSDSVLGSDGRAGHGSYAAAEWAPADGACIRICTPS